MAKRKPTTTTDPEQDNEQAAPLTGGSDKKKGKMKAASTEEALPNAKEVVGDLAAEPGPVAINASAPENDETATNDDVPVEARETSPSIPNEYRLSGRQPLRVKAIVQFKSSETDVWKEAIEVTTISRGGAALQLSKECPVGRLITLALQMPVELRAYDFYQDVYPTLAVIQNCSPITVDDKVFYQIGVAFIGKKMPDSFRADPTQCYRIIGQTPLGLWRVTESERAFKNRRSARFWRQFEIGISIRDNASKSIKRHDARTRDVSAGGMSVWSSIQVDIGDRVKVMSKEYDFFGMALVKNRTEAEDPEKSLIHLEFDGVEFPIARVRDTQQKEERTDRPMVDDPDDR